jgi:hypothetical protein
MGMLLTLIAGWMKSLLLPLDYDASEATRVALRGLGGGGPVATTFQLAEVKLKVESYCDFLTGLLQ